VQYARGGHGAGRAGTVDDFKDHWGRIFDWFATHFAKVDEKKVAEDGGG
jgi:hypothetical protein